MLVQSYLRNAPSLTYQDPPLERPRSGSISSSSQTSSQSRTFEHYREPTILDQPETLQAIQQAIETGDEKTLAGLVFKHGLPSYLRAEAWPLLLRQHPSVLKAIKTKSEIDERTRKRIHGDLRRMQRNRSDLASDRIYDVVVQFLSQYDIKYETPMLWVCDFVLTGHQFQMSPMSSKSSSLSSSPQDSKFAFGDGDDIFRFSGVDLNLLQEVFTNIMLVMADQPAPFSEFISLIRTNLPTLSEYFQCEGMLSAASSGDVWLVWWLRWFGIRSFPTPLLERLWDQYFSFRNDFDNESFIQCHMQNCITLMRVYMSRLLELDVSECRQFLCSLPECQDVEAVVQESADMAS